MWRWLRCWWRRGRHSRRTSRSFPLHNGRPGTWTGHRHRRDYPTRRDGARMARHGRSLTPPGDAQVRIVAPVTPSATRCEV
jgi:hypothetical protein